MSHITAAGHGDPLLGPPEESWDRPTDAAAEDAWYERLKRMTPPVAPCPHCGCVIDGIPVTFQGRVYHAGCARAEHEGQEPPTTDDSERAAA